MLPPLWMLTALVAALAVWLLFELKEIVVLLVVGYCIAYLIDPLVTWLERRGVRRSFGVIAVFAAAAVGVLLLFVTAIPTVLREYDKLATNFPDYLEIAKQRAGPLLEKAAKFLPSDVDSEKPLQEQLKALPALPAAIKGVLFGLFEALLSGYSLILMLVNLALLPFIVFYISVDFDRLHHSFLMLLPVQYRKKAAAIGTEIDTYVSAFVRGQLMVGFLLCILYAIGLRVIGVELWLLLALISGFGNLIPYLGSVIGIALSTIMALVTFVSLSKVLVVWGLYAVVQFIEGSFITPQVVGEKVGLSPLAVILAIFAGGTLFGLLGIFLAVPAAAALRVLFRHVFIWLAKRAELAPG